MRKGRGGVFADCGLGKTPMQLVWADNIARHSNGRVLGVTTLGVSHQTVAEGQKFGIECHRSRDGQAKGAITVTNYDQLHKFNPNDFRAMFCDESSILKNFDGTIKTQVTEFMRKMRYRSLWTATAAPNDYIELGTSSEALGYLGHVDMLNRFFVNDRNNSASKRMYGEAPEWRFKGHAESLFWRWVVSWARAVRHPRDLGFSDESGFDLPALCEHEHLGGHRGTGAGRNCSWRPRRRYARATRGTQAHARRQRCERAAELVNETGQSGFGLVPRRTPKATCSKS